MDRAAGNTLQSYGNWLTLGLSDTSGPKLHCQQVQARSSAARVVHRKMLFQLARLDVNAMFSFAQQAQVDTSTQEFARLGEELTERS